MKSNIVTFSKGKVTKDPITGRFVSVKSLKPVYTKAAKEAAGEEAVEILSALYGVEGNRIEVKPIVGKKINNKIAGSDPAPGVKKNLVVEAKVNGEAVTKTFNEGEVVAF